MEGIMNLPANVGGATSQDGLDSFAPLIAAQQAARDMGYPRFTRELLSAGSEMDQAEVQEFLQTIRDAGLTSDDVAMMRRVVEAVFGDPNNYPQVRARLLAEGVPEDILPETFDLEFFTALRMAAEEAENLAQEPRPMDQGMAMEAPIGMAEGGIVGLPQMTPIAREMAAMGRNGDTMLAHITPQEAMMLQRMGGSGTINPYTGLPEFFLKKLFRGVSKAISSVGKAVKKFVKSDIGRLVTTVALGAFLGPMAVGALGGGLSAATQFALSAGIGTFGSGILAGDGFKNSLRNGLTAGATAYVAAGVTQGFSTPAAPGGPTNLAEGYRQGLDNIKAPFRAASDLLSKPEAPITPTGPIGDATAQVYSPDPTKAFQPVPGTQGFGTNVTQGLEFGLPDPASISSDLGSGPSLFDRAVKGTKDIYTDYLSPSRAGIQPPSLQDAVAQVKADYVSSGLKVPADDIVMASAKKLVTGQTPGMFTKYAPLAATGIGALALTGNLSSPFEVPEQEPGESYEAYMARRQAAVDKFRQERPEFFGSFLASPNQGIMSTQPAYSFQPVMTAARGSGPKGVENFPRKTGAINGPGTGTSDDIPAMLSDGEFVFTAKAVRNMGGGSRRKGAAKMYKLMKMLEGGAVDKTAKA